jgi:hypothetical protein
MMNWKGFGRKQPLTNRLLSRNEGRKVRTNTYQDNRYIDRDSNRKPYEYKSRSLWLHELARFHTFA